MEIFINKNNIQKYKRVGMMECIDERQLRKRNEMTLPSEVVNSLDLKIGDYVRFKKDNGNIIITKTLNMEKQLRKKNEITIPIGLIELLNLKTGNFIRFKKDNEKIIVTKAVLREVNNKKL